MAITYPLVTGWIDSFTISPAESKNVGSGSNRRAYAILGNGDTALTPSGFTVGSDTLTLVGSTLTDTSSRKWRLYAGDLTVTGTQTCTPTWSGTSAETSYAIVALLVVQGDAALTIDGVLSLAEFTTGGGGGEVSRTVTTTTGDVALAMFCQYTGPSAGTAGTGTTLITADSAYIAAGYITADASTEAPAIAWGAFTEGVSFGMAIRESGGGGGTLTADQGSFTLTGQTTGLLFNRVLTADYGAYALTGQDTTLTYVPAQAFSLVVDAGAYSLTGQTVTLQKDTPGQFTLQVDAGSYTWTGNAALIDTSMNGEQGSYSLTGQDVTFSRTYPQSYSLNAAVGSYTFNGNNVRLDWSGAPIVPNRQAGIYMGMRIGL